MRAAGLHYFGGAVYPSWITGKGQRSRAAWMDESYLLEDLASFSTSQAFRYGHFTPALPFDVRRPPQMAEERLFDLNLPPQAPEIALARAKAWSPGRVIDLLVEGPKSFAALSAVTAFQDA